VDYAVGADTSVTVVESMKENSSKFSAFLMEAGNKTENKLSFGELLLSPLIQVEIFFFSLSKILFSFVLIFRNSF
jgi:hypothetical protein